MNPKETIRRLIKAHLSDNYKVDGVEFVDQLLVLASKVGEIRCTLAGDSKVRIQIPDQPTWHMELDRAQTKLRLLCARLGVLCNESGDQEVSLYGGEGVVSKMASFQFGADDLPAIDFTLDEWKVRFKNTPSEQEFTITCAKR